MKILSSGSLLLSALILPGSFLLSSCTVDQESALFSRPAAAGSSTVKKKTTVKTDSEPSWAEKMAAAKKKRDAERAEAAEKREKELAAKKKEKEAAEKKLAAEKKVQEAKEKALAARIAKEEEAEEKKKAAALALKKKKEEADRAAKLAAREKAKAEREARRNAASNEVPAVAERSRGGGFFSSLLSAPTSNKYKSEGHYIYVNQRLLDSLNSSNSKIEIDISEQRARVFKTGAAGSQLVIETSVSTGKPGHSTSPGSFRIKEKMVAKRSTLYGRWVNSSGSTVQSSGDSRRRPSGGSRFIGAEMPYWMRINGGIGMHIGYVPNYPASHGCIRVPPVIQPLIFSKVGVGTSVTIKR